MGKQLLKYALVNLTNYQQEHSHGAVPGEAENETKFKVETQQHTAALIPELMVKRSGCE